jgi:hypothetical protein
LFAVAYGVAPFFTGIEQHFRDKGYERATIEFQFFKNNVCCSILSIDPF